MARAKIERHALVRAAAVSLALHFFAMPLFVRAGDARFQGAGRDGDANETVRVATITFDRRTPPRRNVSNDGPRRTADRPARDTLASQWMREMPRVPATPGPRLRERRSDRPQWESRPSRIEPGPNPVELRDTLARDASSASKRTSHHSKANDTNSNVNVNVGPSSTFSIAHASSQRGSLATIALTLRTPQPERNARDDARPSPAPEVIIAPAAPNTANSIPTSESTSVPPSAAAIATPVVIARAAGASADDAPGGWGQTFARPLVADEAELAALRSRFPGIRTIAIDVDASGRAIHVAIPASVTGDARAELARTLLALRYVPAECNGLRCTGTMQLAL